MGFFTDPSILQRNLTYLLNQTSSSGLNPTSLSKAAGVPQPTIHRILKGESRDPRSETVKKLAAFFGISPEFLRGVDIEKFQADPKGPEGERVARMLKTEQFHGMIEGLARDIIRGSRQPAPTEQDYVRVPRLNIHVAAGNGREPEHVEVQNTLAFRREWLAKKGLSPDSLEVYEASGDSMAPFIENGDVLLVDIAAGTPKTGEVWVLWQDAPYGVRVKRLLYRENGDVIIRSDNPDKALYPDEIVPGHNGDSLKTIGKVVWRGG